MNHLQISAVLAAIMLWPVAAAQADVEAVIADCAAMSSYDGRVSCLEDALRTAHERDTAVASNDEPEDSPDVDDVQAATDAPSVVAAVPAAAAVEAAPEAADPAAKTSVAVVAAIAEPPQTGSAAAPADEGPGGIEQSVNATTHREAERFGLREPAPDTQTPESIKVLIVAIDTDAFGKQTFSTEDGQIWKQTERNAPRYRDLPFEAEIRKGAMGSYFMKPLSSSRSIRVRRSR
ncbi:MAG: hypothetical protein R3192_08260 [Woeseiaceae bacterium]|nr:hypothetical protein [Woeseiaceae bacterium]